MTTTIRGITARPRRQRLRRAEATVVAEGMAAEEVVAAIPRYRRAVPFPEAEAAEVAIIDVSPLLT